MKFKLTLAALIIAPIMLTACAKKEEANNAEQQEQAASTVATQTTPEQQNMYRSKKEIRYCSGMTTFRKGLHASCTQDGLDRS